MKNISKIIKRLLLIPLILIGLLILLFIIAPIVNEMSAASLEKRLSSLPLPQSSELRDRFSAAGKLVGSGNGMQFFGAILIETELSQEELEAHYAQYREGQFDCIIELQTDAALTMIEHGSGRIFPNWQEAAPPKRAYIVYTWGSGNGFFSEFDLRGH